MPRDEEQKTLIYTADELEPDRLVRVSAHRELLDEIIDSLMQGTQFLALTGTPRVGKPTMAAAIHEELNKRSVPVRRVDGCRGTGIHLRTIMSQVLGKSEADVDADDTERLFYALTERETPNERRALIIDDAERLLPDALAYLRLLVSVAQERMPQIVFIGDPSFWDFADKLTEAGFKDLITARLVLEPLNSTQTSEAAEQLISAPYHAPGPGLGSEATTTDSNPSRGRVTVAEAASTQLESGAASPVADGLAPRLELGIRATTHGVRTLLPDLIIQRQSRSGARIASAAAVVVGTIGAAAYWLAPFGIDRIWTEGRAAVGHRDGAEAAPPLAPDATIQVRLPLSATALQDQSDAPNFDSASEFQAAAFVPMSASPGVLATPRIRPRAHMAPARAETVPSRKPPDDHLSPATSGTWLFPPNANGGS